MLSVLSKQNPRQGMVWAGPMASSNIHLHSHIKGNSVLKACRADMPMYAGENYYTCTGRIIGGLKVKGQEQYA